MSVPSKAAVTVRGTKGGLPEARPVEALVASHFRYDKILQAPHLNHRFHSKPSFVELHAIKVQTFLEVAHNPQPMLIGSLHMKLSGVLKKASSEEVRKGKAERTRTSVRDTLANFILLHRAGPIWF